MIKETEAGTLLEEEVTQTNSLFSKRKTHVSDIRDLVMEGRRKIESHEGIKEKPLPLSEISSSEVKDFLRERIGKLTIEGTINEMYLTIKNMESQIQKILDINTSLKNDLKVTKDSLQQAVSENGTLFTKINKIEEEGPLRLELERELKELIVEHNKTQETIQDLGREKEDILDQVASVKKDSVKIEEEREDAQKDAFYYQTKTENLLIKVRDFEDTINTLNGEVLYYREKIKKLEEEISDIIDEKNATQMELKECKESFDEIYEALIETKIKTKKFFYQELKGE